MSQSNPSVPPLPRIDVVNFPQKAIVDIWLYLARMRDAQVQSDVSQFNYNAGSPVAQLPRVTLPIHPPAPEVPTGLSVTGLYKQMMLTW